jgi:hypothetical protein
MAPHIFEGGRGQMTPDRAGSLRLQRIVALAAASMLVSPTIAVAAPRPADPSTPVSTAAPRTAVGTLAASPMTSSGPPRLHAPGQAQPFLTFDSGKLRAAKLRAAARSSVGSRAPLPRVAQPEVGLFNGLNKAGLGNNLLATPPDATGAIGPTHYVEMVNQAIGVYDRNLNSVSSTDLGTFTLAANWTVTDPQVQWDGEANRWLYAALGVKQDDNVLLFGWSKTANPSDLSNGWCRFGFLRQHMLDDYPKLGHDDDFVIIGTNVYDDTNAPDYEFLTANVWAIPKPAPGSDTCVAAPGSYFADGTRPLLNADGSAAFTPVPANTTEAAGVGYVLAAHTPDAAPFAPKIMTWHVASSGGAPVLVADSDVAVPDFGVPAPAPQPGSALHIDTLDARLTQAVAETDATAGGPAIWTQHTIDGPGGRSVVRWYEVVPWSATPLRQSGDVSSASDFMFNGAISPTTSGDSAVVFYNRGGSAQLPVIGAVSRTSSTPLGTMDPGELLLGTSSAVDQNFSCSTATPCRWGDYAGASPDPLNANVVWGSSQVTWACFIICGLFAQWQTRNFAVELAAPPPPPPPTPPSAPQSLTATGADASVTLNWAAPSSDGGSQVTDYTVYRGTSPGSEVLIASSGGALTYTDTGLTNGQPYYYVVHAVNVVGEGSASNEASATPQPSITPPSAPRNLAVAPFRPHGLRLTWLAPLTDGGSDVTAYQIWRGTAPGAETLYVTVGTVTSYTDAGATNKKVRYYYVVRAVNTVGAGPPSNEVNALGR